MYRPASNKSVQNIHRVEKFSIAQARWKFSRIRRVSFTESSRFLENDSSARYTCDEWRSRCATRVHEPRLVTETGHRGERRKASRGSEECRKEGTYVRTMSGRCLWLKSFTEWSSDCDTGKQREGRGEREAWRKNTRILRRTSAKCSGGYENRSVYETTVARLTDDCRASGGVATLRGQRVTRGAITKVLSLTAPELAPFPSLCLSLSRTLLHFPLPLSLFLSLAPFLFVQFRRYDRSLEREDRKEVCTLWSSGVTLAERRVNRRETEKRRETEREKLGSSSRRRRHTASLCARLRLGTLASLFVYWSSPLRTSMHIHSTVTHTYEVYKDGVV